MAAAVPLPGIRRPLSLPEAAVVEAAVPEPEVGDAMAWQPQAAAQGAQWVRAAMGAETKAGRVPAVKIRIDCRMGQIGSRT